MNWTRALAVAGVVAFAVGVATLAAPGLFALGGERVVVVAVGVLALGQSLRILRRRRQATRRRAGTADPERPRRVDRPGESLEAVLDEFVPSGGRSGWGARRTSQLKAVAVEALARYRDLTPATARERVERGTWTDDPAAGAFLGGDRVRSLPLRSRLRIRLAGETPYRNGLRQTVAEIATVAGLDARSRDGASSGSRLDVVSLRDRFGGRVETGDPPSEWADDRNSRRRLTGHWRGVGATALAALGVGVLAEEAAVLLAGVVGVSYAAYASSTRAPEPALSVERTVSPDDPSPEDAVEVTVTVTNVGDRPLPDLRLVDGVPSALSVVDGSPRCGTPLRAGGTVSMDYTVDVRSGTHEFDPLHVVARNLSGSVELESTVAAEEPTRIRCVPPLSPVGEPVPLRNQPTGLTGRVDTSIGGEGTEFHATRTYRPGDPMNRIDWNRQAKTGELATLEFREERAVDVVLVVDADESAAVGPDPRGPDAVDRSVEGARQVFTTLLDDGNRVGLTALAAGDVWIPPDAGEVHRARVRERLATDPAFRADVGTGSPRTYGWLSRLRSRLPSDAQVVLFSPLCSDAPARLARRLDAHGYPVTVVSPDPTVDETDGTRLAAVVRRLRISELRAADVPVIDWPWDDSLAVTVARSARRWSR